MKLGMIGLKGHQRHVLNGAQQLGGFEIVGVAETNEAKVAQLKRRAGEMMGDAPVFEDWRRLLDHTQMDVCCVCDENGVRFEQLMALADLGVHIVTEKPLTTTLEDLHTLRKAVDKSPGRLTMLLTMRHEPKYVAARQMVADGAIGELCQATAQKSYRLESRPDWFRTRERLGGTIPYIGIHAVDLIRFVGGRDYTHVAAIHGRQAKRKIMGETESHASLLLGLDGGASATVRLDYLRPSSAPTHGDDRIRLAGAKGVLETRGDLPNILLIAGRDGPTESTPPPTSNLFVEFIEAIREDRPSRIPADDCFYATEVVLLAREAADTGRVLEIPRRATA